MVFKSTFLFRGQSVPVTCSDGVSEEEAGMAVESYLFKRWYNRCEKTNGDKHIIIHDVEIQSVDLFGARGVGFLKIKSNCTMVDGLTQHEHQLPGICFLRGDGVSIFVALHCEDGKEYSLLVSQPRVPIGCVSCLEVPAGMLDDESESIAGIAVKEMEEECGIKIQPADLVDLTALACRDAHDSGHLPTLALPTSPGGCDESIRLMYVEKKVSKESLEAMRGRLSGIHEDGEYISLRVVDMAKVWQVSGDLKAIASKFLVEQLRADGKLPVPGVLATPLAPRIEPRIHVNGTKCEMPQLAFGLYKIPGDEEGERVILDAIHRGYRHFDGASFYGNETAFGRALKKSGLPRQDFYITGKVWNDAVKGGRSDVRAEVEKSLSDANCDYFDLFLIHWPVPGCFCEAYKELEDLYKEGKLKALGVSNFDQKEYEELLKSGIRIPVTCNQLEVSPVMYRKEMVEYFQNANIVVAAYKPLQRGAALDHPLINELAKSKCASPAQIMLRWGIQKGFLVIAKTVTSVRMMENRNLLHFELNDEDMAKLDSLTSDEALRQREQHEWKRKTSI